MKTRSEFSLATKRSLANAANNQCSYLNCPMRTSGPDLGSGGSLRLGKAAHIYSASPCGPRGQGGLSREELKHHQNGIWLCADHATLIDENNGVGHPAAKLFSYKRLHEHRVQKEILGTCKAIGWIDEIELVHTPLFEPGSKIRLGKLSLVFGNNSLGKSTLAKFLGSYFDVEMLGQWKKDQNAPLEFRMNYYCPDPVTVGFSKQKGLAGRYEIGGEFFSKNPVHCRIILVPEFSEDFNGSAIAHISHILDLPEWEIVSLIESANSFPFSNLKNYQVSKPTKHGSFDELSVHAYEENFSVVFRNLSTTEKQFAIMDLATALARKTSIYQPTLLFLDCNLISNEEVFRRFESLLLARENQFQTILTARLNGIDLADVQWRGWEVVRLYRESSGLTKISQDPKMKVAPEILKLTPRRPGNWSERKLSIDDV